MVRLVRALRTWPWRQTAAVLRERFKQDRLGLTASSLTFTTIIAMVPLFTVTLAVFSAFPLFGHFQDALQRYFLQTLVPPNIARPVLTALTQFASKADRLGTVGLVALLLTALALMLTIDRTLNGIWRVPRPRPITQRMLIYWAALTLGPVLFGASLTFTSYVLSASGGMVGKLPGAVNLMLSGLEALLLAVACAGLFHYVPNTHVRWSDAFVGGVFVAVGIQLAKQGMTLYLSQVQTYAVVYGTFATLPLLLIWIYLAWVMVLLGAVLAACAPSIRMGVPPHADAPGERFTLALAVLHELIGSASATARGLTAEGISQALRVDPVRLEPVLDALVDIDWIGRLHEFGPGGGRYVLLCDPARAGVQPLVGRLLLTPAPALGTFWRRAGFDRATLAQIVEPPPDAPPVP